MTRIVAFAPVFVGAALLGVTDGSAVRVQNPQLAATVGPGFFITLENAQALV